MTKKIAVSLPDDVAEYLATQPNASATVAAAVRARMRPARLEEILKALGYEITEDGKGRWRQQLTQPMSPAALEQARRLREQFGITA